VTDWRDIPREPVDAETAAVIDKLYGKGVSKSFWRTPTPPPEGRVISDYDPFAEVWRP
jgi:hypothetical protein